MRTSKRAHQICALCASRRHTWTDYVVACLPHRRSCCMTGWSRCCWAAGRRRCGWSQASRPPRCRALPDACLQSQLEHHCSPNPAGHSGALLTSSQFITRLMPFCICPVAAFNTMLHTCCMRFAVSSDSTVYPDRCPDARRGPRCLRSRDKVARWHWCLAQETRCHCQL